METTDASVSRSSKMNLRDEINAYARHQFANYYDVMGTTPKQPAAWEYNLAGGILLSKTNRDAELGQKGTPLYYGDR